MCPLTGKDVWVHWWKTQLYLLVLPLFLWCPTEWSSSPSSTKLLVNWWYASNRHTDHTSTRLGFHHANCRTYNCKRYSVSFDAITINLLIKEWSPSPSVRERCHPSIITKTSIYCTINERRFNWMSKRAAFMNTWSYIETFELSAVHWYSQCMSRSCSYSMNA